MQYKNNCYIKELQGKYYIDIYSHLVYGPHRTVSHLFYTNPFDTVEECDIKLKTFFATQPFLKEYKII